MASATGFQDISGKRPYGAYNLRQLALDLWKKLERWIDESYGSNDLHTIFQPVVVSQQWNDLKIDFQKWNARMMMPHDMENTRAVTGDANPMLVEEQFLYRKIKDKLVKIVEDFCSLCKQQLSQNDDLSFYNIYALKAGLYFKSSVMLDAICDPLNSSWIAKQPQEYQVFNIRDLCSVIWREKIVRVIGFRLRSCLTKLISLERQGQGQIDAEAMSNVLISLVESKYQSYQEIRNIPDLAATYSNNQMTEASRKLFLDTHIFNVCFGNEFYYQTQQYIQDQARIIEDSNGMTDLQVMRHINQIILTEESYAARGFHQCLVLRLGELLTRTLIIPNVRSFYPVFRDLLANGSENEFSEFAPIFRLLNIAGGERLDELAVELEKSFCIRTQNKILALSTSPEGQFRMPSPTSFGQGIVQLYNESRNFIKLAMQDNPNFFGTMNRGISRALDENKISEEGTNRIGLLLSQFLDSQMKDIKTDSLSLQELGLIIQLLTNRDIFLDMLPFYFGKRLLCEPSVRPQLEREMVEILKEALDINPDDFNTMLADMASIDTVTRSFLRTPAAQVRLGQNDTLFPLTRDKLEIRCLTTPAWSKSVVVDKPSTQDWILPPEASYITTKFKETFEANNRAQIVTPVLSQTYANMEWSVGQDGAYRTYTLSNCNVPMYIVLKYFGERDSANFTQIQLASGLDDRNLTSVLEALSKPVPGAKVKKQKGKGKSKPGQDDKGQAARDDRNHAIILIRSEINMGPTTVFTVNEQFNVRFTEINLRKANTVY